MRILVVTSSFGTGGYGRHCAEVSGYLVEMGHTLYVLTCSGENTETENGLQVFHLLKRDPDWSSTQPGYVQFYLHHWARERHNLSMLVKTLNQFNPDIVFVWQGTNLHRSLFVISERMGYPVVYRLCDYWPSVPDEYLVYWQKPVRNRYFQLLKRILALPALWLLRRAGKPITMNFDHSICVSEALYEQLRQVGVPLRQAVTIFNGINLQMFWTDLTNLVYPRQANGTISLLYGGGLLEHKGVHVTIEALHYLRSMPESLPVRLTIIGEGSSEYIAYLHNLVNKWQLADLVHFEDAIPRTQMPALLRRHDILLFPSLYEEPLARMMQEAMAAGWLWWAQRQVAVRRY